MKILFVVPYAPTPIRTRPYNLLRELTRRGHAVTLATLWQNEPEREALREMERYGISVIAEPLTRSRTLRNTLLALPTGEPLQPAYCWQPSLQSQIAHLPSRFDIIHVEHLRGARYGLHLKSQFAIRNSQFPIVWDSVDCISHLFEQASRNSLSPLARWMTAFELERTRRYEGWLVHQFDQVLVTSSVDKEALEKLAELNGHHASNPVTAQQNPLLSGLFPTGDPPWRGAGGRVGVAVLPNGVDLEYFQPSSTTRQADTLVFSGKMSYHANVTAVLHFAREILPLIWKERPQAQLWIVGQAPPSSVKALASDPRITVTGYVPDVRPYLSQATVAVCPVLYGAGIQNKVLEAMACATPVVSRSTGLGALQAQIGEEAWVGDTPQEFARQVLRLLADPLLATQLGRAGRRYVERHHGWPLIGAQLEGIYQEAIESWNSRRPR